MSSKRNDCVVKREIITECFTSIRQPQVLNKNVSKESQLNVVNSHRDISHASPHIRCFFSVDTALF